MSEWSKEFPNVEGFYWARRTQTSKHEAKVIEVWQYEGDWYAYRGGVGRDIEAEDFTKSLYEFLGPISPADTERLVRLEKVLEATARTLHEVGGYHNPKSIPLEKCQRASCVTARGALEGKHE